MALFAAGLQGGALAQAQIITVPVSVTGFNQDVVANGSGTTLSSTTYDMDGSGGNGYCFMAPGFINPAGQAPITFFPASGVVASAVTSGLTFQLASYSANNSLRIPLTGSGVSGTGILTFATPRTAADVYVLWTSGGAASTVTPTITFTDGTTQVFASQTVFDWYNGTSPALMGFGRVSRNAASAIENLTTNPRLYQTRLVITSTNYAKPIQSVSFNKTSTAGVLNVMALSVTASPLAVRNGQAQVAMQAYPNPATEALTLQVDAAERQATAQLLDLTGRELQTAAVKNQQAVFSIGSLSAGVYMVRYRSESGTKTLKVVKE